MDANLRYAEALLIEAGGWDLAKSYGIAPKSGIFQTLLGTTYPHSDPGKGRFSLNQAGFTMLIGDGVLRIHTDVSHAPGLAAGADMRSKISLKNRLNEPTHQMMALVEEARMMPRPLTLITVGASPMRALEDVHVNLDPDAFIVSGEVRFTFDETRISEILTFCEKWGIGKPRDLGNLIGKDETRRLDGLGDLLSTSPGRAWIFKVLKFRGKATSEEQARRDRLAEELMTAARRLPSINDASWAMAGYRLHRAAEDAKEAVDAA